MAWRKVTEKAVEQWQNSVPFHGTKLLVSKVEVESL